MWVNGARVRSIEQVKNWRGRGCKFRSILGGVDVGIFLGEWEGGIDGCGLEEEYSWLGKIWV